MTTGPASPAGQRPQLSLDLGAHVPVTDPAYEPNVVSLVSVFHLHGTQVEIILEVFEDPALCSIVLETSNGPLRAASDWPSQDFRMQVLADTEAALALLLTTPTGRTALADAAREWEARVLATRPTPIRDVERRGLALIWAASQELTPALREAVRDATTESTRTTAELGHAFTAALTP